MGKFPNNKRRGSLGKLSSSYCKCDKEIKLSKNNVEISVIRDFKVILNYHCDNCDRDIMFQYDMDDFWLNRH